MHERGHSNRDSDEPSLVVSDTYGFLISVVAARGVMTAPKATLQWTDFPSKALKVEGLAMHYFWPFDSAGHIASIDDQLRLLNDVRVIVV